MAKTDRQVTDLSALVGTFYQTLTGPYRFSAADPLRVVHFHLARLPSSPRDHAAVPEPFTLIMKFLARTPRSATKLPPA
jgi:hypothetical protein